MHRPHHFHRISLFNYSCCAAFRHRCVLGPFNCADCFQHALLLMLRRTQTPPNPTQRIHDAIMSLLDPTHILTRAATLQSSPTQPNPTQTNPAQPNPTQPNPAQPNPCNTQVIDTLVDHFMTFTAETRVLPVLWHQSLLVFAQRYRGDITRADKDRLKEVQIIVCRILSAFFFSFLFFSLAVRCGSVVYRTVEIVCILDKKRTAVSCYLCTRYIVIRLGRTYYTQCIF